MTSQRELLERQLETLRGHYHDEFMRRMAAEAEAREHKAILWGMIDPTDERIPLWRRIGNQRRALRDLNNYQHIWFNVLTYEERNQMLDRWQDQKKEEAK